MSPARSATSPVQPVPLPGARFSFRRYLLHLTGILLYFSKGLTITLRAILGRAFLSRERDPVADREGLVKVFREYFKRLEKGGGLILDLEEIRPQALEKGLVLAANHPCLFDAMAILTVLPRTVCVMRASLMRHPALHGGAGNGGFISNDRGADFIRLAVDKIHHGENLLIFPEGTRTDPGKLLNPFKGGTALISIKAGAPVQMLLIDYTGTQLRKGVPLWKWGFYPVRLRVRPGPRLRPMQGETAHDFSSRLHAEFLRQLEKTP